MVEHLVRHSPLERYRVAFSDLASSVSVREEPYAAMVTLWAEPSSEDPDTVSTAIGLKLPTVPSAATGSESLSAVWMGPEEWLIVSHVDTPSELEQRVRSVVSDERSGVVDVSAQRTTIRLSGERANEVLRKGCSIDLFPTAFGSGNAVQTTLGFAEVILIPCDDSGTDYRILVRAAFAHYLAQWLIDACQEYVVDET